MDPSILGEYGFMIFWTKNGLIYEIINVYYDPSTNRVKDSPSYPQSRDFVPSKKPVKLLRFFVLYNLPHNFDTRISLDDRIELKSRTDGKWESKLWRNINIKFMLLFFWIQTTNRISEWLVCLVEMRKGKSDWSTFSELQRRSLGYILKFYG